MTSEKTTDVTVIGLSPPLGFGISCTTFNSICLGTTARAMMLLTMSQSAALDCGGECFRYWLLMPSRPVALVPLALPRKSASRDSSIWMGPSYKASCLTSL